jgi:hypothetical protein
MADHLLDTTGSTVVGDTKVKGLVNAIGQAYLAQRKLNKDAVGSAVAYIAFSLVFGPQMLLTASITLPSRNVEVAGGKIEFKARDVFAEYVTYDAGTGDLVDAENLPQAIVEICERMNFAELQINPNVVITQANQITVTQNKDAGTTVISVSLPIELLIDETTGEMSFPIFDYLEVAL